MNAIKTSSRGKFLIPIADEHLNNRSLFLVDEVNSKTTNELIEAVLFLEKEDCTKEITLYINSPGGEVSSGLALYDCLTLVNSPIKTVCIGTAAKKI